MITRRHMVGLAGASALAPILSTRSAFAQKAWPNRLVKLVVPFPPGGGTDVWGPVIKASGIKPED